MKKFIRKPLLIAFAAVLMLPVAVLAQTTEREKKDREKEKTSNEQIIINRKSGSNEKVVVEINGDKVTVNGKPIEEYKGEGVTVHRGHGFDNSWSFLNNNYNNQAWADNFKTITIDSNRAMLGVTTEKADKGVEIQDLTKESGAAKAGLKEGDVITKIDDKKIETPDDLSKVIRSHKPGEKVAITYLRDDKEQKTTAELGRWKGASVFSPSYQIGDLVFDKVMPKVDQSLRNRTRTTTPYGQNWSYSSGTPKLGLSVQDTDDGKGVKVIEVDHESNASKAGLKEEDIITEVEGKAVNSADDVAKIIKESKDKNSVMVKLTRGGKTQNVEVKIPRKLKTADL